VNPYRGIRRLISQPPSASNPALTTISQPVGASTAPVFGKLLGRG